MYCPPGSILNPQTLRCIKTTSRIAHDLAQRGVIADYLVPAQRRTYRRPRQPRPCRFNEQRNPATGRCRKIGSQRQTRRQLSEAPYRVPGGVSTTVPMGADLRWIQDNCRNTVDPVSRLPFSHYDLPDIVRLHDRTCVKAPNLHTKISTGRIPGTRIPLTQDDLNTLQTAMRRRNPAYMPARNYRTPPPEWQLYVASDFRSGPDYASVLMVDTTKALHGPNGVEYPPESIRVDLGFIPLRIGTARCSAQTVLELTHRLANAKRLLKSDNGSWRPVGGFPYTKKFWETDGVARLTNLCASLLERLK
jgi:hypothetical protein